MGNHQSSNRLHRVNRDQLATLAMAKYLCIKPHQLRQLLAEFQKYSTDYSRLQHHQQRHQLHRGVTTKAMLSQFSISRRTLHQALKTANIRKDPDRQVMDLLFTMWEGDVEDRVDTGQEFLMSLVPLACPNTTKEGILRLAFELANVNETKRLAPARLTMILTSMNATFWYFGDASLSTSEIQNLVTSVLEKAKHAIHPSLDHDECVRRLLHHTRIRLIAWNLHDGRREYDSLPAGIPRTVVAFSSTTRQACEHSPSLHRGSYDKLRRESILDDSEDENDEREPLQHECHRTDAATARSEEVSDLSTIILNERLIPLVRISIGL
ncbi:hypothetical protein MPSEU_000549800 [Mayamaea pseudoterrestris]|nr:hypothetical protein MPSEU_000549800 [Mayamaea pseudoterrestris]